MFGGVNISSYVAGWSERWRWDGGCIGTVTLRKPTKNAWFELEKVSV